MEAGEAARVADGVLGTLDSVGDVDGRKPCVTGALIASPRYAALSALGCRNSRALLTDSGTFCSLIDSEGGGAAGKGRGMGNDPEWLPLREPRLIREVLGEPGWKDRGGETRLTEARRETEAGEMLREEVGEGGEPAVEAREDARPLLLVGVVLRGMLPGVTFASTPRPVKLLRSRDLRFACT